MFSIKFNLIKLKNKAKETPWPRVAEFNNFFSNSSVLLCGVHQVSRVAVHYRSHCEYVTHKAVHQARKYHEKPPNPLMKRQRNVNLGWFLSHTESCANLKVGFPSPVQITPIY